MTTSGKLTNEKVLSRMLEDARKLVTLLSEPNVRDDDDVYYICEDLVEFARHVWEADRGRVVEIDGEVQVDVESL